MLLTVSVFFYAVISVFGELAEPEFQVISQNELMVQVPHQNNVELVTFRIGIRREDQNLEDLERGDNFINDDRIFIYDQRLNLRKGDTINYLAAFRDNEGYRAITGSYVFDGVYRKKPFGHFRNVRRHIIEGSDDEPELESRFGHGWPHHNHHHYNPSKNFNAFGPPHFGPRGPPFHDNPFLRVDCNDHRHDICHNQKPPFDDDESPEKNVLSTSTTTTSSTSTTTPIPDIDIRFNDNN